MLEVALPDTAPQVWRRVRVPAGISLQALQEQVLAPVMGWPHHDAWRFIDFEARDGVRFVPMDSQARPA